MYFGTARFWDGGHESAGVSEPSANWFLAEGATGSFFDTFVLVANPNPTPTDVDVDVPHRPGRSRSSATQTVAANARLTVNMEEREPAAGQRRGVDDHRRPSQPIIVERAMYWPGDGCEWSEAHNSFGVTATGTKWGLAEGRVGHGQGVRDLHPAGQPEHDDGGAGARDLPADDRDARSCGPTR